MFAQSLQSCLILWNPMGCRLPGSSVHGILPANILEWVAISFSRGSNPCHLHSRRILYHLNHQWSSYIYTFSSVQSLSHVWLFATPWIAARQASLSITNSQSLLKPMTIELVMPSSHLILCRPLHLLPPICIYVWVYMYVYMCMCICVCVYMYEYICMCIYVCVYI